MGHDAPPRWDRRMQQRLAHGEAAALGELYDRFASLVHSLAYRVLDDEDAADRVTREVFAYVWEHPDSYDPKQGPLRSWVAGVTRHQAVQRLRQTEAASARDCGDDAPAPAEIEQKIRDASTAARADFIVTSMPAPLRAALELAYFQRRDYRQTAADLGVTEDEARRRLRLGLQLLSTAHSHQALPPAHRTAPTPRSAPASPHSPHAPQAPHSPRGPRPPHTQHTGPGNSAPPGPGRGRSL
ncbi:sigma-70 family RNA polymerase sigma factor [Streptomyces decoyicus]|uniref:sigma-70 family RNA polymerase sigma factor n=1 Tax=Streptomyces decoyicus TaxID=249567 RepID=UPI0036481B7B